MSSTPQSRLDLLVDFISIPSVTQSPEEDLAGKFVYDRLASLDYFKENPDHLTLYPTPLERDSRPLHTVFARVMAPVPTPRTVVLIGHFDVVEVSMYGELRDLAFSPHKLHEALKHNADLLDHKARADLESGRFLFGRGSMDMKCGLALGMELLRDFSENRNLFDVNLLLVAVPDEENSSAGMRGAVKELVRLQEKEGLEYICALNTEPSEPGRPGAVNQVIFTGTVGKISPVFLCVGQESHVGNYYRGLSAPLLAAQVVALAEANPDLADPAGENTCPSWICLGMEILRESYSVTVPNRAVAYFNGFSINKTPAQIMNEIRHIAAVSIERCLGKVQHTSDALLQ
ncbi:MAG: M20/M25/M40 family metallo-hydrolase, partial [Desulfovibrionaceae bacterium]|nr:M20/M25/M40 family metallo-hydrolase [Desulfovibrionaceae bacterium]